ncbi:MarR family transcriptional regulator, multiple antibiotic resistance protein MarR [Collimonas sp. OK307]|uniref:MarR family winged helix-turn-helix transcriptional regulator n=1 Tax=Collimonas sp. OK307 TaxID=1801620 RepID=UPI0008E171AD|nr:MarR family transcriptional regulator [Collimonas sp. OK307]SFI32325.1 MarR family transcriptional regulator, multiple antibiotic resistance protein MarR [Collimonas sp. OK307]
MKNQLKLYAESKIDQASKAGAFKPESARTVREVILLVNRLQKALWHAAELTLTKEDLNVSQWLILSGIARGEGATLTDFSRLLAHDAGALSRSIHLLAVRGLITTHRKPHDRRSTELRLSEDGFALAESIEGKITRLATVLGAALGVAEVDQITLLMERSILALEEKTPYLRIHRQVHSI